MPNTVAPKPPHQSSADPFRPLPHSLEAEQGVLGSMLIAPATVISFVFERLTARGFYQPAHATIFGVLVQA